MIVVYDFDKTLTYKDTLLGFFLEFSKNPLKLFIYFLAMVFAKLKLISNDTLKEVGVRLYLYKKTKDEVKKLSKSYAKKIKTNFIYKDIDYSQTIYIVSASFEEYLKPLFPKEVFVVASKLRYKDGRVDGVLFNCYGENKIKALKNYKVLKIDSFFTDSYSDLPLVKISKKTVVIKGDEAIECESLDDFKRCFKR